MADRCFTHAIWHVTPGREREFEAAWARLGEVFLALPQPPGPGRLLRHVDGAPYVSFGSWPSLEAIAAMRDDATTAAALAAVKACCDDASPGAYEVVAVVGP